MKFHQTTDGKLLTLFHTLSKRSHDKGWLPPTFSYEEFLGWADLQGFPKLYSEWRDSSFDNKNAPSVDRIKASGRYTLGNMQLITWEENAVKGYTENRTVKEVHQYDMGGSYIQSFKSTTEAAESVRAGQSNIASAARGKQKSCKGFVWSYER